MKKIFAVAFGIVFFSLCSYAQTATGSCQLPGSYDYVKVGYYEDGHLAISNQSSIPLAEIHVTVTCQATWKERVDRPDGFGNDNSSMREKSQTITLCDQDFYDIPTLRTTTISNGVHKPSDVCSIHGVKFSNFQVYVGNLICKQIK